MGLDTVDFVLAVEKRFNLHIDDSVMTIRTTRQMIDYLTGSSERLLSTRAELVAANVPRETVTPSARLDWLVQDGPHVSVRELVHNVIKRSPPLQLMRDRRWTRDAVKQIVYEITEHQWGIDRFSEDALWCDLGED